MIFVPAGRSELVVPAVRAEFIVQVRAVRAGVAHGATLRGYTEYICRERGSSSIYPVYSKQKNKIYSIYSI